jgi:hypothetical protein
MRRIKVILIALLCLPLIACFEDPVQEHLHVTIRADRTVVVTVVQEVASSNRGSDNPELADRLDESRDSIAHGYDRWSQRFSNLHPLAEHQSLETVEGEVRRSVRSAVFASFEEVVSLIEADGLTGSLTESNRSTELQLLPTGGSRATYLQRQEAERLLEEWSRHLADYFAATSELYSYLDRQPERTVPCLAHVFDIHEGLGATGPLTPTEENLVDRTKETMEEVAMALLVDDDEAFSLNELSRLVYDPFPARLTVAVQQEVVDSIGFVHGSDHFERPAVDVWNALRSLEGRWIAPDLVTAAAAPAPDHLQPEPDIPSLSSQRRFYSTPPTSAEVESAILAALVPEEHLVLRFRSSPETEIEPDLPSQRWLTAIAEAESSIPD